MKKRIVLTALVCAAVIFSACKDFTTNDDLGKTVVPTEGKGYISLSVNSAARIVAPTAAVSKDEIKKIVLSYRTYNADASGSYEELKSWVSETKTVDGKEVTTTAFESLEAENSLLLDVGTYDFTLDLYVSDKTGNGTYELNQSGAISEKEISSGTNELAFTTQFTDGGKGFLSVVFTWNKAARIALAKAGLFYADETGAPGAAVKDFELGEVTIKETTSTVAGEQVTMCSASYTTVGEVKPIPSGYYWLKFYTYQDAEGTGTPDIWCDLVQVVSGCTSSKTVSLAAVNTLYDISYDKNSGEWKDGFEPTEIRNANTGVVLPTAEVIARTGYVFAGWALCNADGTEIKDDDNVVQTVTTIAATTAGNDTAKDYYLKAQWTPITYTISFNANSDGASGTITSVPATYDEEITLPSSGFVYTGFTFKGWMKSADGTSADYAGGAKVLNLTAEPDEEITLYALWLENDAHTITYNNVPEDVTNENQTSFAEKNEVTIEDLTRTGYTFGGWFASLDSDGAGVGEAITGWNAGDKTADVTLYAQWTPITYTISFDRYGGDEEGADMDDVNATYDVAFDLPKSTYTKTGYLLAGWKTADSDEVLYTDGQKGLKNLTTTDGDIIALLAVWKPITYTIAFDANGGTGTMESMTATYNDTETASPTNKFTRTGYTFAGWSSSEDAEVADYSDEAMLVNLSETQDDTVTLYAVWEAITYTIMFDPNAASVSGEMESMPVTYDEEFALPQNTFERTGYTFAGWARSADGAVEYADSQDKLKNLSAEDGDVIDLYAKWTANSVGISVTLDSIEKDPDLDFAYDPDTKTFSVDGTYDLYAWSMGGETVGSASSYTVSSLGAGSYTMTLAVKKGDDVLTGTATFTITVVEQQTTFSVTMETIADDEGKVTVSASGTTLTATTTVAGVTEFAWAIDGVAVESTGSTLDVSDYPAGTHDVTVAVADADDVYTVQGEFTITK